MSFSKEIWGNNIWYLFHGIARKINEKKFKENKEDIIFIFKNICNTLPCPECSKDAIIALNKVNFNLINNKDDFELLIFNFHNSVNKRTGKKDVPLDFIVQYKDVNMLKAWIFFEQNFFSYYKVNRSFNSWQRNSAQEELKKFFKENWSKLFS